MKQVSGQFSALDGQLQKLEPAFTKMAAVGTVAFGAVAGVVGMSVNSFIEAERATRQLEHAVIDVSKGSREQVDAILAVTDALQKKSGVDGDALAMGAAQLSTFGLQTQSVLDLTKSMADLTVNQSGLAAGADDYVGSANTIAKALNGQFGVLEKSGIRFTEAQQQLIKFGTESEKVAALTEGLNQNLRETTDTIGETAEGGMARLNQSLGDVAETIGAAFLPIIQQVVEKIVPVVQKVTEWAAENPKLVAAILAAVGAAGLIVAAIGTLGLILPSIIAGIGMLSTAVGVLGTVFTILTGPVGIVIAVIAALIAAGVMLYKHWDEVKAFAISTWESIKEGLSTALNAILGLMNTVWKTVQDVFWFGLDFLIGVIKAFMDFFFPGWEATFTSILNTTLAVFEGIKLAISGALSWLLNTIITPILTAIKGVWDTVWGGMKDAFLSMWDSIKGAATSAFEAIQSGIDALMGPLQKIVDLANAAASAAKAVLGAAGKAVSSAVSAGKAITGRALGGPVGTDGPHWVGENGPEMFWPNTAGRITPNGFGMGGLTVVLQGNTFVGQEGIAEQIGDKLLDIVKRNIKL